MLLLLSSINYFFIICSCLSRHFVLPLLGNLIIYILKFVRKLIYIFSFLNYFMAAEKPNNISTYLDICFTQTIILNFVKAIPMSVPECEWKLVNNMIVLSDLHINFSAYLFSFDLKNIAIGHCLMMSIINCVSLCSWLKRKLCTYFP